MSTGRHSYIAFYPSDWIAGTARMTPLHELVYFRVCLYNWDKGEACPATELPLMLGGVTDWRVLLLDLVQAGKLVESPDGSLASTRAMSEAAKAQELWEKKSRGGKSAASKANKNKTPAATPAESHDMSPGKSPASTHGGTDPALPAQNQNQTTPSGVGATLPSNSEVSAETENAVRLITAFDACQESVFGALKRQTPHGSDLPTALRWVRSGLTIEFCEPIFLAKFNNLKAQNLLAPKSLSYLTDALAEAKALAEKPMPKVTDDDLIRSLPAHLRTRQTPVPKGVVVGSAEWHDEQKRLGLEGGEAA